MAQALRKQSLVLEENGIVRSTVFPNAVRDVRMRRGYDTLRAFDGKVDVTYTRLAKIERGEIFPTADEMVSIARAMGVPVSSLLIDPNDPSFDREKWAREHIEASLSHRGGGIESMKLGAAVRVCRLALGRSTTDMKTYGLPAATVSRIENADRPIERWDAATQKGIAKVLATHGEKSVVRGNAGVTRKVGEMFEAGQLDDMLHQLFSPEAIQERNNKRLKVLLAELPTGKKVAKLLQDLDVDGDEITVLSGPSGDKGVFTISAGDRRVSIPAGAGRSSIAIEVSEPVLGPGLPRGTVIVADPEQSVASGDVAVILSPDRKEARLLSVQNGDNGLYGFSMAMDSVLTFSSLPEGTTIAKMVAAVA
jgi:transcriptional regulator with XRE-family HTH domain